jgi:rod shape determining protein RodA
LLAVDRRLLQNFDWGLCALALALAVLGVGNLVSTAPDSAGAFPTLAARQFLSLLVAVAGMVVIVGIDYRNFERLAWPAYGACVALLILVLLIGPTVKGSQRWLVLGSLQIQPVELTKLGIALVMARIVHRHLPTREIRLRDLALAAAVPILPSALVLRQPDLGSGILLLLVAGSFLLIVSVPLRWLAWLSALGSAAAASIWSFYLRDYQKERLLTFLNPDRDPLGAAYQTIQSKIAVGSGGLVGQGFPTQSQLQFLPEQGTDFAFSVLAEEWGFVGAAGFLFLYLWLLLKGLVVARTAKDLLGSALALGAVAMLFWPAAVNVAMVVGLLPVVGVPLPFLSYGGSSLLASFLAVGVLINVSMRRYVF